MLREMGIALRWREAPPADAQAGPHGSAALPEARVAGTTAADAMAAPVTLQSAAWLVVGDAVTAADATAADQERLLDNMLAAIGLARSAPSREQRAAFVGLPEPSIGEGREADAWLDAAIDAVRPAGILALGRAAAQAVLDTDEPLGALRGRREQRAGVPVIVTFSPAFLLRHPVDKAKAWADLCLAVRCLEESDSTA